MSHLATLCASLELNRDRLSIVLVLFNHLCASLELDSVLCRYSFQVWYISIEVYTIPRARLSDQCDL